MERAPDILVNAGEADEGICDRIGNPLPAFVLTSTCEEVVYVPCGRISQVGDPNMKSEFNLPLPQPLFSTTHLSNRLRLRDVQSARCTRIPYEYRKDVELKGPRYLCPYLASHHFHLGNFGTRRAAVGGIQMLQRSFSWTYTKRRRKEGTLHFIVRIS